MLEIEGDYVQTADGILRLEIGGTDPGDEFDVLQVGGIADLAGDLAVVLIDGFQPALDDSFGTLDFGLLSPRSPGFDTVSLRAPGSLGTSRRCTGREASWSLRCPSRLLPVYWSWPGVGWR